VSSKGKSEVTPKSAATAAIHRSPPPIDSASDMPAGSALKERWHIRRM
jgi:hypothetical protein